MMCHRDGIKAIDPVAAAQAHPSLRPTALDIGDVVFKYTGIMPGAGKIGNDAGFEPVAVELIEEFETEKGEALQARRIWISKPVCVAADTPLAGLRLYGSPLYHAAEMADSVFRHWRPSVMGGSSRGRLTPANGA